jgi:hypothetical protein
MTAGEQGTSAWSLAPTLALWLPFPLTESSAGQPRFHRGLIGGANSLKEVGRLLLPCDSVMGGC